MDRTQIDKLASKGSFRELKLHGHVIETHISWVIISKRFAFKVKRPVSYSFVDFSSLASRKKYCYRELELNAKWSDIYKEVCPVRDRHGEFAIGGGQGRIVDYAVVMRKVAEGRRMDILLQQKKVSIAQVRSLAARIANAHSVAMPVKRRFSLSYAKDLFNDIGQFAVIVNSIGGRTSKEFINKSISWSDRFLERHKNRFEERIRSGFQRDVHGDLHSANIFIEDKPVIFDCIEFNDRYRQIDILYDLAFLAMDMEANGHPRLADALVREYANESNCFELPEDLELFNYFKCLRASVRMKVHLLQVNRKKGVHLRDHHISEARKYIAVMRKYISRPEKSF